VTPARALPGGGHDPHWPSAAVPVRTAPAPAAAAAAAAADDDVVESAADGTTGRRLAHGAAAFPGGIPLAAAVAGRSKGDRNSGCRALVASI